MLVAYVVAQLTNPVMLCYVIPTRMATLCSSSLGYSLKDKVKQILWIF